MLSIITSFITILNLLIYVYVILMVVRKKQKSEADKRFFLVLSFSFLWILISYFQGFVSSFYPLFVCLNYSLAVIISGALVSFAIHYPKQNKKFTFKKEVFLQLPVILFAILSFTKFIVTSSVNRSTKIGFVYKYYLIILILYFVILGAGRLILKYKRTFGIDKTRLKFFLIGYLFAIVILLGESIYFNLIAALSVPIDRLVFNSSIVFSSLSVYSMIKYRFLDIRIAIRRSLIQFFSLSLLFGVYLSVILVVRDSLSSALKNEQVFVLGFVILIIVATFEPIRKMIYSLVNKLFEKQDLKNEELRKKTILISRSRDTYDNLLQSVANLFKDFTETDAVAFIDSRNNFFSGRPESEVYMRSTGKILIPEELPYRFDEGEKFFHMHKELQDSPYSALIPIGQDSLFIGFFGLGKRKKGKAFSVQEVRELRKMQDQFTEALLNARLYHQAISRIMKV